MAVPEAIRKVPRPVNTIVEDSGSKGNYRYAVRARAGARYNGGNPMPKNGRVIGHIIDGQFVPIRKQTANDGPDMLSYGAAALFRASSDDLLQCLPGSNHFQEDEPESHDQSLSWSFGSMRLWLFQSPYDRQTWIRAAGFCISDSEL